MVCPFLTKRKPTQLIEYDSMNYCKSIFDRCNVDGLSLIFVFLPQKPLMSRVLKVCLYPPKGLSYERPDNNTMLISLE